MLNKNEEKEEEVSLTINISFYSYAYYKNTDLTYLSLYTVLKLSPIYEF
jgi:hypothetical protein